jgi:hypothetical protein
MDGATAGTDRDLDPVRGVHEVEILEITGITEASVPVARFTG